MDCSGGEKLKKKKILIIIITFALILVIGNLSIVFSDEDDNGGEDQHSLEETEHEELALAELFVDTNNQDFNPVYYEYTTEDGGNGKYFEIYAKRFEYAPNIIKVNLGDEVRIKLISTDVTHGIYLDGYELKTQANPGSDGSLSFVADKPGRYTFRCSVTCGEFHPYMIGYLEVEPNLTFLIFAGLAIIIGIISFTIIHKKKEEVKK